MIDEATADADDERCQLDYLTIQVLTEAVKCIDEEQYIQPSQVKCEMLS